MKPTVIALANQKGGVGKTTTAVNLGIGLARQGKKALLVDADSQGNLTDALGWNNPDALEQTLPSVLRKVVGNEPIEPHEAILHHDRPPHAAVARGFTGAAKQLCGESAHL